MVYGDMKEMMEPGYLSADEIQHECQVRYIPLEGSVREWVAMLPQAEREGQRKAPEVMRPGVTATQELLLCQDKCQVLQTLCSEGMRCADQDLISRALAKFMHITGRLRRLLKNVPHLELTIDRLIKDLEVCSEGMQRTTDDVYGFGQAAYVPAAEAKSMKGQTGAILKTRRDAGVTSSRGESHEMDGSPRTTTERDYQIEG